MAVLFRGLAAAIVLRGFVPSVLLLVGAAMLPTPAAGLLLRRKARHLGGSSSPGTLSKSFDPLTLALAQQDDQKHPCSASRSVSKETCLGKAAKQCMWMKFEGRSLCTPCELQGVNIPCVANGALYGGEKVAECAMQCAHQQLLSEASACTDVGHQVSASECRAKGTVAMQKCMWTRYTDKQGAEQSVCGPCEVKGLGVVPVATEGQAGPEGPGSTVLEAESMCEEEETDYGVPCNLVQQTPAVTDCHPVPGPPAPPQMPVPLETMGISTSPDAPEYFAVPVLPPYGAKQMSQASEVAAQAAGWPVGTALVPDAPVAIFGPPPPNAPTLSPAMKVMYGPAPPGLKGVPPPGYGYGTVPPPESQRA